ncbi:MAG: ArnT family glycosyltransferase [Phycisphaerales bacterium]
MTDANATHAWHRRTAWLIAGVTLARLLYVLFVCPYALAEDEAHYWEWSLRPDWSYYSKGPGVAWSIWLATTLFGHDEGVIRLPAVLAGAVLAVALVGITRRVYRGEPFAPRAGFVAAALVMLTPAYQLPAVVMTIDGPYLACWALASWMAARAFLPPSPPGGEGRGEGAQPTASVLFFALFLGAGFLYKYTILLILPGLVAFLIIHRRSITRPSLPALLGTVLIALAAIAPVLLWNAQHDWVTVKHLAGHLGLAWGDQPLETQTGGAGWSYDPRWTLELIGTQLGIAGLTIALGIVGMFHARARRHAVDQDTRLGESLMLWLALPIIVFYLLVTLATDAETNWPIAGYLTLIPLAARAVAEPAVRPRLTRGLWRAAVVVGCLAGVLMLRLDWLAAGAQRLGITSVNAGRLLSGPGMGRDFAKLRDRLADETGLEPFIVSAHYGRASLLAYYLPDRPSLVYAGSAFVGGRQSQYDFWPETDLTDLDTLAGRPAILLGETIEDWRPAFERVEQIPNVPSDHKGDRRTLFLGYGYRGFPEGHP